MSNTITNILKWRILLLFCAIISFSTVFAQTEKTHLVKRGETFASIAKKYGLTESELRSANPYAKACYTGMKLNIKKTISIEENKESSDATISQAECGRSVRQESSSKITTFGEGAKLIGKKDTIRNGESKCVFSKYLLSDGKKILTFDYSYSYNNDYTAHVTGIVKGVVAQIAKSLSFFSGFESLFDPGYILYEVLDPKAKVQGIRVCLVDYDIHNYLSDMIGNMRQADEHYGVEYLSDLNFKLSDYCDAQEAPNIDDEVQILKSKKDGKITYILPKY